MDIACYGTCVVEGRYCIYKSDCLDDSGFRKVCDKSSEGPSCGAGLANRRPNVTGAPR